MNLKLGTLQTVGTPNVGKPKSIGEKKQLQPPFQSAGNELCPPSGKPKASPLLEYESSLNSKLCKSITYSSSFLAAFSSLAALLAATFSFSSSLFEWFFLIHFHMPLASRGPS